MGLFEKKKTKYELLFWFRSSFFFTENQSPIRQSKLDLLAEWSETKPDMVKYALGVGLLVRFTNYALTIWKLTRKQYLHDTHTTSPLMISNPFSCTTAKYIRFRILWNWCITNKLHNASVTVFTIFQLYATSYISTIALQLGRVNTLKIIVHQD